MGEARRNNSEVEGADHVWTGGMKGDYDELVLANTTVSKWEEWTEGLVG